MALRSTDILTQTPQGLYCPLGDFHIDPVRPVKRALVTHGHSDHARSGHRSVLATRETLLIMAVRYGADFAGTTQDAPLGESLRVGDVTVRFTPAGHVLGSAQIAIEAGGTRVVVSGDYKRAEDPTCLPYEVVPCDVFITEATFGLPVFRHPDTRAEVRKLLDSVALFPERAHIVGAYALGKAQRVMALLREEGYDQPIHLHGAMERLTEFYKSEGIPLGETPKVVASERSKLAGAIVICPPSSIQDLWSRRFPDPVTCFASGWMRVRARARQKGVELPLVISDHSDWDDLCRTIRETGAGEVWVTHGQEDALVHWCTTHGIKARPLHMLGYGDEGEAEEAAHPPLEGEGRERSERGGVETPHSKSLGTNHTTSALRADPPPLGEDEGEAP
jgi:putative mRNA 3-end processing factor